MRQLLFILIILAGITTASAQSDTTSAEELRSIIASLDTDPATRDRATYLLGEALKNAPGTELPDMQVVLRSGEQASLREMVDGNTLLIFYDPYCPECHELMAQLTADDTFNSTVAGQRLKVIAVYPEYDMESWGNPAEPLPAQWIDAIITPDGSEVVYDLFSIPVTPSTFFVGCDRSIVLKHPDASQILQIVRNLH